MTKWTHETLYLHFQQMLEAHENLDIARQGAYETALEKAERSLDKRLDAVNEFRQQLADQVATFLPKAEYVIVHQALIDKVESLERSTNEKITGIQAAKIGADATSEKLSRYFFATMALVISLITIGILIASSVI